MSAPNPIDPASYAELLSLYREYDIVSDPDDVDNAEAFAAGAVIGAMLNIFRDVFELDVHADAKPRDLIADLNADMIRAAENLIEPGFPDTSSEYVRGIVELILDSSPQSRNVDPDHYRVALTAHFYSREA